jgi:acyl-CoA reductase-like NAD-dependent aldehyde dehydrogenase
MDSKTFDNGTICASEQSVICEDDMAEQVQKEMEKQGAYFLNEIERKKLGDFILRANGTMNPMIVGKSVQTIAELAEIKVPEYARVLVAREDGIGRGHPYSNEKLAPILAFFTAANYEKACDLCTEILHYEGAGHTFCIHSKDEKIIDYFSRRVPASRIVVNTPGALGGIGGTTGLMPALTLGCGAIGGSATSENVGPMNLLDIKRVAYNIRSMEDIKREVSEEDAGMCKASDITPAKIEEIVQKIIKRLQSA